MTTPSNQPGTTTIVRRVQEDGSEESWEQFVGRYEQVIVEYAIGSGLRADQAEDLRQTVFLELVKLLPTMTIDPSRGTFRSILRTVVKRRTIDLIRLHYKNSELMDAVARSGSVSEALDWDAAWEAGLMKQALLEVSEQVNPVTYQAFELVAISSVPPKEVAKLLGISVDSVYQSKRRVKTSAELHYKRLIDEADGQLDQHSNS